MRKLLVVLMLMLTVGITSSFVSLPQIGQMDVDVGTHVKMVTVDVAPAQVNDFEFAVVSYDNDIFLQDVQSTSTFEKEFARIRTADKFVANSGLSNKTDYTIYNEGYKSLYQGLLTEETARNNSYKRARDAL